MSMLEHDKKAPDVAAESDDPQARVSTGLTLRMAETYGFVLAFVAVIIVFSVLPATGDTFASLANVRSIIGNQSTVLIISVGMVIPLLAGNIDLSVGATAGATSVVTAAAVSRFDVPLGLAIVLGMVFALIVGVVNGILIARVSANSFIITFGVGTLIGGLLQWYTKSLPITANLPKAFQNFGNQNWLGLPRLTFALIPIVIVALILQDHTPYGRHLQAIGSNERAARLVGIPVQRSILLSFVASSALAGAAGIILTARSGGADPAAGPSFLFPAFAAVFLGMAMIRPGKPNVIGTVIAVLFLAAAVSGFTMAGANSWVRDVFNGAALLIAISMATWFGKRQGAKRI